jgi:hypothetical protein
MKFVGLAPQLKINLSKESENWYDNKTCTAEAGALTTFVEFFCGFPQFPQMNVRIVPITRPRTSSFHIPSKSLFTVHPTIRWYIV